MVCHRDSQEAYRYWQVVKASALAFGNPRGESNHILCVAVERINVSLQNVGSRRVGLRVFLRRSVLCFGARFRSLTCELVAWKVFGTTTVTAELFFAGRRECGWVLDAVTSDIHRGGGELGVQMSSNLVRVKGTRHVGWNRDGE